ncbi:MBL fold metallo-hydrolase [Geoglobus sp.]
MYAFEEEYGWSEVEGIRGLMFLEGFENSSNIYFFDFDEAFLIDAGNDYTAFLELRELSDLSRISGIFLTHAHNDHTLGLFELARAYSEFDDVTVYLHASMRDALQKRLERWNKAIRAVPLRGGEVIQIGDHEFTVLDTPGHTLDSMSLYSNELGVLFSGDAVITNPVVDENLGGSIRNFLMTLRYLRKLEIRTILPGHGFYAQGDVCRLILDKAYLNALSELAPEKPLKDAAKAALMMGLVEEAEFALRAHLELDDSSDQEAILGLASILADRGELDQVESLLREMIDGMDENGLYVAGMAAMNAEKFEKAAEYFSKLVEVSRSRTARLLYATALYESGKVGEAMKFDEFRSAYMRFTQK